MKKIASAITVSLLAAAAAFGAEALKPEKLTVGENFENPVGYSLEDLSFSWQLPLIRQGIKQSAYQIVVTKGEDASSEVVWDSGKVESSDSVNVPYGGKPLESRERLYWRVKIWDENGEPSIVSDTAFFEAGLLSNSEWKGKWISTSEPVSVKATFKNITNPNQSNQKGVPPTYLRKDFDAKRGIEKARLYVTCRGIFQFYINGKKVGDDFWGTGWTNYHKRIQANTYDVTDMLRSGSNAMGALLGDGWYSGRIGWQHVTGYYGKKPEILAQLEITYSDGTKDVITTDETWKSSFGPITSADIYDGEQYDARLEMPGWNDRKFDDSAWKPVAVSEVGDIPSLDPRRNQPIVVKDELVAVSVNEIAPGTFIFDMGQNMVGWPRIKIPGSPDREIKIRYAEMLNQDGTLYTDSYRSARSTDYYTSASRGTNVWEPTLTFHGFRYVELSGFPKGVKPSTDWVTGIVLYNDMPMTGSFASSKPKVNLLQSNIQWGQRGNFFSVPTDCPQRDERLGWLGDAQAFVSTAAFNMNVSAFFTKWTLDMRDAQGPEGYFPHVAPDVLTGGGAAAWADAGVICPWEVYLAYGNEKILRQNYDAMKKWVDFQKNTSNNLIRPDEGFGDWLQPNGRHPVSDAPKNLIGTAYFVYTADIVSKVAKILGHEEDSKAYAKLANEVREAFNREFVSGDGTVKSDSQTVYLLALGFNILPEEMQAKAMQKFVAALERDNMHLNTGFVGTPLLNLVLTKFGRMDLAYRLLNNETYPSWIYPINQGATTMWERWNSYSHENGFGPANMNSFNHYAYGAVGHWMYKDIAGLWLDESKPGYKNIIFAPKPGGGLTFAAASHETPYGLASSSWKLSDGVFEWTVRIPANATGTLVFPTAKADAIRINGFPIASDKYEVKEGTVIMRDVPSGNYEILFKN